MDCHNVETEIHKVTGPVFYICGGGSYYSNIDTPGGKHGDSGTDLVFQQTVTIPATNVLPEIIDLGVRVRCVHNGEYVPYQIVPRSSIVKTPTGLANSIGIIDRQYTGTLKVAIRNFDTHHYRIPAGSSLYQLVLPSLTPACVKIVDNNHPAFSLTTRGEGGFGSTGISGGAKNNTITKDHPDIITECCP